MRDCTRLLTRLLCISPSRTGTGPHVLISLSDFVYLEMSEVNSVFVDTVCVRMLMPLAMVGASRASHVTTKMSFFDRRHDVTQMMTAANHFPFTALEGHDVKMLFLIPTAGTKQLEVPQEGGGSPDATLLSSGQRLLAIRWHRHGRTDDVLDRYAFHPNRFSPHVERQWFDEERIIAGQLHKLLAVIRPQR